MTAKYLCHNQVVRNISNELETKFSSSKLLFVFSGHFWFSASLAKAFKNSELSFLRSCFFFVFFVFVYHASEDLTWTA